MRKVCGVTWEKGGGSTSQPAESREGTLVPASREPGGDTCAGEFFANLTQVE